MCINDSVFCSVSIKVFFIHLFEMEIFEAAELVKLPK